MGKLRVQDVAKELGVPVKEVREVLKEWGIDKGNFAYLDEEELQIVYDHFSVPKEKPVENGSKAVVKEETVVVSEQSKEEKQKEEKTEPKREEKRYKDQRQRDKRHHERTRQPAREAPPPRRERAEERERPRRAEERRPFPARVPAPPPMLPTREQRVEEKPQKPQPKEKLSKSEEQMLKKLQQPVKKEKKEEKEEEIKIVQIPEVITVRELADLLRTPPNQIMAELLKRGILATINQTVPSLSLIHI